jgi:hypothetical protein
MGLCLINFCSLNLSNWRSIRSGKVKDVENGGRTRAKNGIDGVEFLVMGFACLERVSEVRKRESQPVINQPNSKLESLLENPVGLVWWCYCTAAADLFPFLLVCSVSCFAVILVIVGEVINGIGEEIMAKARD